MPVQVTCACGQRFTAADALAGGLTNCPRCGQATAVPGLRDPFWRVLQIGAVAAWCVAVAFGYETWGLAGAVLVGLGLGGLFALIRLAF